MSLPKLAKHDALGIPRFHFADLIAGYDYASLSQASTTDTYIWKQGGSSGITLATMVITYTDSTKATISNWTVSG